MKARLEKKLTQAQLAQQINELPKIVQDYEAGKAIPNQAVRTPTPRKASSMNGSLLSDNADLRGTLQIISKMERVLGVPLRPKKR